MSQTRVNDFFSTRKRNRFNQDEVLLNKQKKSQTLSDEPPIELTEKQLDQLQAIKNKIISNHDRTLRSRNKQVQQQPPALKEESEDKGKSSAAVETEKKEKVAIKSELKQDIKDVQPNQEENSAPKTTSKPNTRRKVNMAELKQKIQQFNQNLIALQNSDGPTKEATETKTATTVQVTAQSQKLEENASATATELPAYLKFKDIASKEIDQTTTLTLPKTYSMLLDAFKGSDTIVKFLYNRQEVCTFLKLRMGIQNITKHTFTLKHLGQIKTVYEKAYTYKQEKLFVDFKNDYHLIVLPQIEESESPNVQNCRRDFNPAVLLKRLNNFKMSLFDIVKKYHQAFLESIGLKDVCFDNIRRWHQKFDLENLKEIEEAELPKPPTDESIKCKTGQELLSIAKDIYSSRIQKAIEETGEALLANTELDLKKSDKVSIKIDGIKSNDSDQSVSSKLKEKKESNYNSLLEKIRNKEKQKAFESMVVNSDKEKNLTQYSNIKDTIRLLSFFFQSEKKSTIELEKVCQKMADNLKSKLNDMECKDLLKSIAAGGEHESLFSITENDKSKKWLNIIKVRNVFYLQMDKSFKLNDLNAICDEEIDKLQRKN